MPAFCGVFRCGNRSDRDRKSYFKVPAVITNGEEIRKQLSLERREKWLAVLRRPDLGDERKKWLRVCEDHFITGRPADWFDVENPDWIPSLNMGKIKKERILSSVNISELRCESSSSSTTSEETENQGRPADWFDVENPDWISSSNMGKIKKERTLSSVNISELGCESSSSSSSATPGVTGNPTQHSVACQTDFTLEDLRAMENAYTDTIRELIEVRDKVSKLSIHEDAFRGNDPKTRNYTGVPSYSMLMTLFEMLEGDLMHYSASALTKFQRYMLTLMRLRLNLDLNDLSRRFCVSKSTVLKAFQTTVHTMYQRLGDVLAWPDREECEENVPESTQDGKVTVIVNTFEIVTNKPQHAKYANTKKFLIGIRPQGCVTFLSSSYEGDLSDETLLQNCGILEKLRPGDVIVWGRGVGDDDADDVEMGDRSRSEFHVYAERVIRRLRQYAFLQRTMPTALLTSSSPGVPPLIDQVVKVCCCLVNISALVDPFEEAD